MSRATTVCAHCTHARGLDQRHPLCAHPEAKRDPVSGRLDRSCAVERMTVGSFCGQNGDGFWPLVSAGKPGTDGVGQTVHGV